MLEKYQQAEDAYEGLHPSGFAYYITGKKGTITHSQQRINQVILFCNEGILRDDLAFENKIYAGRSLETGFNNHLNEVVAEGDIHLKTGAVVHKLLASGGSITINDGCMLHGYIKAKDNIYLDDNIQFRYLHASQIDFGPILIEAPEPAVISQKMIRQISKENLEIPPAQQLMSHLIAKADLRIQNNCVITGNIKCHGQVVIESHTVIFGSIISEKDIHISSHCFIEGPIVARGSITIGAHCRIGRKDGPTSLIAKNILIASGCRVSGLVLAKCKGVFK